MVSEESRTDEVERRRSSAMNPNCSSNSVSASVQDERKDDMGSESLESLQRRLAEARLKLRSQNVMISGMQTELNDLRNSVDLLNAENDELLDDMDGMLVENKELKDQIVATTKKRKSLIADNKSLKQQHDALVEQVKLSL